jgi:hypothetical protein
VIGVLPAEGVIGIQMQSKAVSGHHHGSILVIHEMRFLLFKIWNYGSQSFENIGGRSSEHGRWSTVLESTRAIWRRRSYLHSFIGWWDRAKLPTRDAVRYEDMRRAAHRHPGGKQAAPIPCVSQHGNIPAVYGHTDSSQTSKTEICEKTEMFF